MLCRPFALALVGIAFYLSAVNCAAAPPKLHVEIELATEKGAQLDSQQRWYKLLSDRGVDSLRIRQLEPGEHPSIEVGGTATTPLYKVFGVITAQNAVLLPGGKFTLSDGAALDKWLRELGENGPAGVTQKKTAFGFTPQQFADVHDDLAQRVGFQTKGLAPREALSKLTHQLKTPFSVDDATKQALAAEDPIRDELSDFSCGTAIAAILRPAGMVLVPRKPTGAAVELLVTSGKGVAEFWPIGWPPEKSVKELAPIYFEFLSVEIDDITAQDAINALHERIQLPFLYDYNGLVRAKIDISKTKIKVPEKKTFYLRALQTVLQQANLKNELRVDENGTPFEWISPLRGK